MHAHKTLRHFNSISLFIVCVLEDEWVQRHTSGDQRTTSRDQFSLHHRDPKDGIMSQDLSVAGSLTC